MKNIRFIVGILLSLACSVNTSLFAKDIYLSSSGSDSNNGGTTETAVKTLSMALTLAEDDDVIQVMDFIDITGEPSQAGSNNDISVDGSSSYEENGHTYKTWNVKGNNGVRFLNRRISIVGQDKETCGFDGKNLTRLVRIDAVGSAIAFSKLTFKNGNSVPNSDSGAGLYVRSSNPHFDNCKFIDNKTDQTANSDMRRGGAFYIYSNIKITNSYFSGNLSREGSALYINSGNVQLENCVIENHDNSHITDADGGAIYYTKDGADDTISGLSMKGCILRNNKAHRYGGALCFVDKVTNKAHTLYIENCAFIANETTGQSGGAISFDNSKESSTLCTTIINSTFYGNQARGYGGAFYYNRGRVGSELNLINCTITGNKVVGNNEGMGPGFRFHCDTNSGTGDTTTKNVVKRIYNTIIENNYTTEDAGRGTDMSFRGHTPENGTDFFLNNSFMGRIIAKDNYVPVKANGNYYGYNTDQLAGLAEPLSDYIALQNSIPLYTNAAAYRNGNAQYLKERGINTDQLGNIRSFTNEKCAAGAIEPGINPPTSGDDPQVFDHIIISGQSLSTGHQAYPAISTENLDGNYMIGGQVWINYGNSDKKAFNPLVANIAASFRNGNNVMSRSAGTIAECPLFGAVNHIRLKQPDGNKILATSVGQSGTSIEELSKESEIRNYYNDFLYSLIYASKISRSMNSTISCPVIFWMQGEFNYSEYSDKGFLPGVPNTVDREEYKALLLQLKNNMQNDVLEQYGQKEAPDFITYQTGAQYTRDTLSIAMAQLEASNENDDIFCAGPVYQMTDRGGHLDSNGYRWYGEMLGKVYYKTRILGEDFKPLQPKEISRGNGGNQVKIKFHVPAPPLVFDVQTLPKIKDYGFEVYTNKYQDGNRQTITNIVIENDEVILTCQKELTGDIIVMYAGSKASIEKQENGKNNLNGHGNLRDSDDYQSFYKYIDLDKKKEDGTYFFPREETETTLRPDFEPKDENGEVIYDKPYPLYNFSVGFFYKLKAGEEKYSIPGTEPGTTGIITDNVVSPAINVIQTDGYLRIKSAIKGLANISFYSIDGRKLKDFSDFYEADEQKEYSLYSISSGLYLVKVSMNGDSSVAKMLIP